MASPYGDESNAYPSASLASSSTPGGFEVARNHPSSSRSSSTSLGSHRKITPNLKRKAHTKSRGGCFNCKTRKIKCQETRPACENCKGKDMICTYPTIAEQKIKRNRDESAMPSFHPQEMVSMQGTPTIFTLTDMRLFHHFMIAAYPHLPLGNEGIWKKEIPVFAQEREYLMHAVLALGASHLSRIVPDGSEYTQLSLMHQNTAVRGFQAALTRNPRNYGDLDALLATCYALTFQASHMNDGLVDFMTMVRGCAIVHGQIDQENAETAFTVKDDWHMRVMSPWLEQLPPLDQTFLEEAKVSLEALQPMLRSTGDLEFYRAMHHTVVSLMISPRRGYEAATGTYAAWYCMGHAEFQHFIDPNNVVARLLQAHFVALQTIMIPLTEFEWTGRQDEHPGSLLFGMLNWGEGINNSLDERFQPFLVWPLSIVRRARGEIEGEYPYHRILRMMKFRTEPEEIERSPGMIEWQSSDQMNMSM